MKHLTTFRMIDAVARKNSIRGCADDLGITPSALLRRIQAFEEEVGAPIFERRARGVRLSAAGEMVLQHIRAQLAETAKLHARLSDLSGVRRGHVSIACSQALATHFLPREISAYCLEHPAVTFDVQVLDHTAAERALMDYSVDLALVFDFDHRPEFQVLHIAPQALRVVMSTSHPLAGEEELSLNRCMDYPWALPLKSFSGRIILDAELALKSRKPQIMIESNSFDFLKNIVRNSGALTFQTTIGLHDDQDFGIISLPIRKRDRCGGTLYFGQKVGRTLSVASAKFADQVVKSLAEL